MFLCDCYALECGQTRSRILVRMYQRVRSPHHPKACLCEQTCGQEGFLTVWPCGADNDVTVDNIMAKVNTNNAAGKRNLLFFLIGILDNFHCPRLRKDLHVLVILHPRSILVCPVILPTCKHKPKHFNILISVSRNL